MVNILLTTVAVVALVVCLLVLIFGALNLFVYANTTSPHGVKIYIACWVLLLPLMALACLLLGLYQCVQILRLILSASRRR